MGDTIWVDLPGRDPNDAPPDHSIMAKLKDELDALSDRLAVARLTDFYDYSEVEAQFADELSEGTKPAAASWFDPAPALAAVRAIRQQLAADPGSLGWELTRSRAHWPAALAEELERCQGVLEDAASRGSPFRLLVVP